MASVNTSGPAGTEFFSVAACFGIARRLSCLAASVSMDPGGDFALKPRAVQYQTAPKTPMTITVTMTKNFLMAVTFPAARSTEDTCSKRFAQHHRYIGDLHQKGVETLCKCGSTDPCTW